MKRRHRRPVQLTNLSTLYRARAVHRPALAAAVWPLPPAGPQCHPALPSSSRGGGVARSFRSHRVLVVAATAVLTAVAACSAPSPPGVDPPSSPSAAPTTGPIARREPNLLPRHLPRRQHLPWPPRRSVGAGVPRGAARSGGERDRPRCGTAAGGGRD